MSKPKPAPPEIVRDRLESAPAPRFIRGLEHWAKRTGGGGSRIPGDPTSNDPICNEMHAARPNERSPARAFNL